MPKIILPKPTGLIVPERRLFIPRGPSLARQRGFMRLIPSVGLWGAGPKGFKVGAADFDGTNDYMTRAGWSGASDSKTGTLYACVRLDGGDAALMRILNNATAIASSEFGAGFQRSSGNKFQIECRAQSQAVVVDLRSSNSFTAGASWHTILASWDALNGLSHMYVDDVSDKNQVTLVNNTIDYTGNNATVGAFDTGSKFNGCLAELWWYPGQFVDFSTVSNRRKFITAANKPVFLGTDGSLPLGSAPLCYFHLDPGESVSNFATNRGSGGNMSITGTLDTASSSPSD